MTDRLAPDVGFVTLDGEHIQLRELRGAPVVLSFLRYIGWLFCERHLVKMASKRDAFAAKRAQVLVVSFDRSERVRRLQQRLSLPFIFVIDRDRVAYQAFGLGRAAIVRTYLDPRVISGYVKMIAAGDLPDLHRGQDRRQLGGDFVIDARGAVVFAHPERGPEDRAPIASLLRAL